MKFYGVSVGCGDYELMTIKAVKILNKCNVIAVPRTHKKNTMALDIIKNIVDISSKQIIYLDFAMSKNQNENEQNHIRNAEIIEQYLKKSDVAAISIGDISVFSTFNSIMSIILSKGYEVEIVPGVPSFCAVAAELKQSLTVMTKPLHIIPASFTDMDKALSYEGTKVIMKSASKLDYVLDSISNSEYALVQNCGLKNQIVFKKGDDRAKLNKSYFTTILVKDE